MSSSKPASAGVQRSSMLPNNDVNSSALLSLSPLSIQRPRQSSRPRKDSNHQRHSTAQSKIQQHHTPPPAGHTFRISISKLLGTSASNRNSDNNATDGFFLSEEEEQAAQIVETLFPDASFTIPSPTMKLEREKQLREQKQFLIMQQQQHQQQNSSLLKKDELSLAASTENVMNPPSTLRRDSTSGSATGNEASKTPAVKRRTSVGSLMMSTGTDDLVGVSKPKFRNSVDLTGDASANDGAGSSSARRHSSRRRSSAASSISPSRRHSSSASPRDYGASNTGRLFHAIDDESSRWQAEDLEVLRLLLRTIHSSSAACPAKRLLPSSGIAARLLLQGTSTYALDAPLNAVRSRITLGNLRSILGSQPHFDHIKINSPRTVTVVLRNGLQCDELIARLSDLLNDRLQSDVQRVESHQLLAKLEFEYRALCDAISRRDAVDFLLEPAVPETATRPTQAELSADFIGATKRRGLMKLARHQHETERIWQTEQERIKKNQIVEERLRLRAEELESRKQKARVQHSMNELDRNKPLVPYRKQLDGSATKENSDDSSDDGGDGDEYVDENGERRVLLDPLVRQQRKEERRRQRLIESRFIYSSRNNPTSRSTSPHHHAGKPSTSERVAKVRAARDAIERRRTLDAHQFEAMRQEQVRGCEARRQDRHRHVAQGSAAHNAHVRAAVTATRRGYEYEQIRRIADMEHDEARAIIRREQHQRMQERLRGQLRAAQHLDLEAQRVIEKGTVTLGQSLEKMRVAHHLLPPQQQQQNNFFNNINTAGVSAMSSSRSYETGRLVMSNNIPTLWNQQQNAIDESQNAMMKVAQKEANLERKWNKLK